MNFAAYIEQQERDQPNKAGIVHGNRVKTYRELNNNAASFANWATEHIGSDGIIGLYLPNHPDLITTTYGAMKAGIDALPINYRFTESEINYVLTNAEANTLVTLPEHQVLADRLLNDVESLSQVVLVDGVAENSGATYLDEIFERYDNSVDTAPRKDSDGAMLMYTSGTTGRPKGVRHTHGNLATNAIGYANWLELSQNDVALNVCPLFHVGGLNITGYPTLASGGTVVLQEAWDPETMLALIDRYGVTWSFLISTMVIDLTNLDSVEDYDLSSTRFIGYGGAPLPPSVAEAFEAQYGISIYGGYGMTETTPYAVFNPLDDGRKKHGSMGLADPNEVDIRIVDPETGEETSATEPGELQIRGTTVTPGYLRSPEADQKAFTEDGWLRSGDIVYQDEDGFLWFVDRKDDMIVTGGENVYPKEVEETLYSHPAIEQVAVIGVPDDRFVTRVKAVLVASEVLDLDEIRAHCESEGLADYKRPREIEQADELPKTASGKIDKKALEPDG